MKSRCKVVSGMSADVPRWIARVIGSLASAIFLLIIIAGALSGEEPWTAESTILTVLFAASALSVLIAWWKEGLGGSLVTACGIAGCIFGGVAAGRNKLVAGLITGGPFVVAGFFFIVSQRLWGEETAGSLRPGK